jgi:hypothetical protein
VCGDEEDLMRLHTPYHSHQINIPVLVEQVAVRVAVGSFWDALADCAATARVPRRHRIQLPGTSSA